MNIPSSNCIISVSLNNDSEYNRIVKENIELKEKILNLYKNEEILKETIKTNEETIEELKKENKILRDKLYSLENKMLSIESELNNIKIKEQYEKYVIAIQDLNSFDELEKKLDIANSRKIKRLRTGRNAIYHYLYNDLDNTEMDYRRNILYNKLKDMPNYIKSIFDKKYPKLIDSILPHVIKNNIELDDDDIIEDINAWWE